MDKNPISPPAPPPCTICETPSNEWCWTSGLCSPECEDIWARQQGGDAKTERVRGRDLFDELEKLEMQWDWAMRWAIGQSFGPWAYHECVEPPPWNDGLPLDRLCKDCRATHDLGVEFRDEFLRQIET
jgi:hypothetical protein